MNNRLRWVMGKLGLAMALAVALGVAGCNGSSSEGDGGLPGKGAASCFCKNGEICVETFTGLCEPAMNKPQCIAIPTTCKKGNICASCATELCGSNKCCDTDKCIHGACRSADPANNYYTCSPY